MKPSTNPLCCSCSSCEDCLAARIHQTAALANRDRALTPLGARQRQFRVRLAAFEMARRAS
jgi:hypothetical protein